MLLKRQQLKHLERVNAEYKYIYLYIHKYIYIYLAETNECQTEKPIVAFNDILMGSKMSADLDWN